MPLPENNDTEFSVWFSNKVLDKVDGNEHAISLMDGYKQTIEASFTNEMQQPFRTQFHMTITYKKLLVNIENNDNSNENNDEIRIFIENPSDRYWFSRIESAQWVCSFIF